MLRNVWVRDMTPSLNKNKVVYLNKRVVSPQYFPLLSVRHMGLLAHLSSDDYYSLRADGSNLWHAILLPMR